MASKMHFSYEEISSIFYTTRNFSGKYKPGGTLGSHCLGISEPDLAGTLGQECLIVQGFTTRNGQPFPGEEKIVVRPGDTLGYHAGEIWLVPKPDSYKNPIRRLLAVMQVSQKCLEFSETLRVDRVWKDFSCFPNSAADPNIGEEVGMSLGWNKDREASYNGDNFSVLIYNGGCAAIVYQKHWVGTQKNNPQSIVRVVVNPKKFNEALRWLEEHLEDAVRLCK